MKFKKPIFLSIMFCLVAIFFISCINASKETVINQIKTGNYQQALEDIHGLSVTERTQVQKVAIDKVPQIVKQAEDKEISYSQAVYELNFIEKIVPKNEEGKINEAIDYIKGLDQKNNMSK
ncbi:MAG: hypothetical protein ACRCTZ_11515 [Sarcina sp.]